MKEKIKEMFSMLPREEQLELLKELTSSTEIRNPIIELNSYSQELYGKNICFKISNIGDVHSPEIKAELSTPWGEFEAKGSNQKIAKARAAEMALLNKPVKIE